MSIAHHLHTPAQVIRAARCQLQTLVLIRNPVDATVSLMVRDPQISASQALRSYVSFYGTIAKYRHAYVLGPYEKVVKDYGKVIGWTNDKFDTQFDCFSHSEDNARRIFSRIEELNRAGRESVRRAECPVIDTNREKLPVNTERASSYPSSSPL